MNKMPVQKVERKEEAPQSSSSDSEKNLTQMAKLERHVTLGELHQGLRSGHSLEIVNLDNYSPTMRLGPTPSALRLSRDFTKALTALARTPNPQGVPFPKPIKDVAKAELDALSLPDLGIDGTLIDGVPFFSPTLSLNFLAAVTRLLRVNPEAHDLRLKLVVKGGTAISFRVAEHLLWWGPDHPLADAPELLSRMGLFGQATDLDLVAFYPRRMRAPGIAEQQNAIMILRKLIAEASEFVSAQSFHAMLESGPCEGTLHSTLGWKTDRFVYMFDQTAGHVVNSSVPLKGGLAVHWPDSFIASDALSKRVQLYRVGLDVNCTAEVRFLPRNKHQEIDPALVVFNSKFYSPFIDFTLDFDMEEGPAPLRTLLSALKDSSEEESELEEAAIGPAAGPQPKARPVKPSANQILTLTQTLSRQLTVAPTRAPRDERTGYVLKRARDWIRPVEHWSFGCFRKDVWRGVSPDIVGHAEVLLALPENEAEDCPLWLPTFWELFARNFEMSIEEAGGKLNDRTSETSKKDAAGKFLFFEPKNYKRLSRCLGLLLFASYDFGRGSPPFLGDLQQVISEDRVRLEEMAASLFAIHEERDLEARVASFRERIQILDGMLQRQEEALTRLPRRQRWSEDFSMQAYRRLAQGVVSNLRRRLKQLLEKDVKLDWLEKVFSKCDQRRAKMIKLTANFFSSLEEATRARVHPVVDDFLRDLMTRTTGPPVPRGAVSALAERTLTDAIYGEESENEHRIFLDRQHEERLEQALPVITTLIERFETLGVLDQKACKTYMRKILRVFLRCLLDGRVEVAFDQTQESGLVLIEKVRRALLEEKTTLEATEEIYYAFRRFTLAGEAYSRVAPPRPRNEGNPEIRRSVGLLVKELRQFLKDLNLKTSSGKWGKAAVRQTFANLQARLDREGYLRRPLVMTDDAVTWLERFEQFKERVEERAQDPQYSGQYYRQAIRANWEQAVQDIRVVRDIWRDGNALLRGIRRVVPEAPPEGELPPDISDDESKHESPPVSDDDDLEAAFETPMTAD